MSDIRLTLIGIALIFVGFVILGVFGQQHYDFAIQVQEFGDCYKFENGKQIEISCNAAMQDRVIFFGIVLAFIGAGIFFLIRGIRGKWDNVKPEDAVGPSSSFPS